MYGDYNVNPETAILERLCDDAVETIRNDYKEGIISKDVERDCIFYMNVLNRLVVDNNLNYTNGGQVFIFVAAINKRDYTNAIAQIAAYDRANKREKLAKTKPVNRTRFVKRTVSFSDLVTDDYLTRVKPVTHTIENEPKTRMWQETKKRLAWQEINEKTVLNKIYKSEPAISSEKWEPTEEDLENLKKSKRDYINWWLYERVDESSAYGVYGIETTSENISNDVDIMERFNKGNLELHRCY